MFDEANAVRLKLDNITVLPRDSSAAYFYMYRDSLFAYLNKNWEGDCSYLALPTREDIKYKGRFEEGNKQWAAWNAVYATELEAKSDRAQATVRNGNDEGAAKVFAELLRNEKQRDVTDFDSPKAYRWFLSTCAST